MEPFGQMLELLGVFKKIWAEFWGPRMEEILRNSLLALMEERLTLELTRLRGHSNALG